MNDLLKKYNLVYNESTGLYDCDGDVRAESDLVSPDGKLVVNITVSPAGKVIAASTNPKLSDPSVASSEYIRNRAESAAKRAKFESIKGTNNQNGTITYFFKIR